jgi:ubiquinone/menaquinone biosynthesis C-methylase UbiE
MNDSSYMMESEEEARRLDMKTVPKTVQEHALWAGIEPGMRVADLGCGSGKTSYFLNKLAGPDGETLGVDNAQQRIDFAESHYQDEGLSFVQKDIMQDLSELGQFDFIWVRFVLEYYRSESFDIVKNVTKILKPGGILCLADLDYNCLTHFGLPERLESAVKGMMTMVEEKANFDPYVGRKLYSFLYDLGFRDVDMHLAPHHLIFGKLNEIDAFNWTLKVTSESVKSGYLFDQYEGGYDEFFDEFKRAFEDPRRFTYTPIILCRGKKPV